MERDGAEACVPAMPLAGCPIEWFKCYDICCKVNAWPDDVRSQAAKL